jgi:flagellar hook-length control protein FliK
MAEEAIPLLTPVPPGSPLEPPAAGTAPAVMDGGTEATPSSFPRTLAGQLAGGVRSLNDPEELAESGKDLPPMATMLAMWFAPPAAGAAATPQAKTASGGDAATEKSSDPAVAAAIALQIPRHPGEPGAAGLLPPEADAPLEPIADADRAAQAARVRLALQATQTVTPEGSGAETETTDRLILTQTQPTTLAAAAANAAPSPEMLAGAPAVRTSGAETVSQTPVAQTIEPPLGDPQWGTRFGERLLWLAKHDVAGAQLRLNPPELGPLAVEIRVEQDQASIQFSAAHAPVREAVENALPQLRELLRASGLQLADVNVSAHGFADGRQDPATTGTARGAEDDETASRPARLAVGLVDLYA